MNRYNKFQQFYFFSFFMLCSVLVLSQICSLKKAAKRKPRIFKLLFSFLIIGLFHWPLCAQIITSGDGLVNACSGIFVDDGGIDGDYSNNLVNQTTIICPDDPDKILAIEVDGFISVFGGDTLDIIMSTDNTGAGGALMFKVGENFPNAGFYVAERGKCITFIFNTNGSNVTSGWEGKISCQEDITFNGQGNGTKWQDPANWDLNQVPNIQNRVFIPDGFQVEIDAEAEAQHIDIAQTASLEVKSVLNINGGRFGAEGILNRGTLTNSSAGTINIERIGFIEEANVGIDFDIFNNAVLNESTGVFINQGTLNLGQNEIIAGSGIVNKHTFTNTPTGIIEIDQVIGDFSFDVDGDAIQNHEAATFTNDGTIIIGKDETNGIGGNGIANAGTYTNKRLGSIHIDHVIGISNDEETGNAILNGGEFLNDGSITIGDKSESVNGIQNQNNFINEGIIRIDRAEENAILNTLTGVFTNEFRIFIDSLSARVGRIHNLNMFTNKPLGTINCSRIVNGDFFDFIGGIEFKNEGTLNIGEIVLLNSSAGIATREIFVNTGKININNIFRSFNGVDGQGVLIVENGEFRNEGNLSIGSKETFGDGIGCDGTFSNSGTVCIDNIQREFDSAIDIGTKGEFINEDSLIIGANGKIANVGIQNDGIFTNKSNGNVLINNSEGSGSTLNGSGAVHNTIFGLFNNDGTLTIGNNRDIETFGIVNQDTFNNTGTINIDNINFLGSIDIDTVAAIANVTRGVFINEGFLNIGSNSEMPGHGIYNVTEFTNKGTINIDGTKKNAFLNGDESILHQGGHPTSFRNNGNLNIGQNNKVKGIGIRNEISFINEKNGVIRIDDTEGDAFVTGPGGSLSRFVKYTNEGILAIGTIKPTNGNAIINQDSFFNKPTGTINIHNTGRDAIKNDLLGVFTNGGIIDIGKNGGTIHDHAIFNTATFSNEIDEESGVNGAINIFSAGTGTIKTDAINNEKDFTNKGKIIISPLSVVAQQPAIRNIDKFTNENCGFIQIANLIENEGDFENEIPIFTNNGFIESQSPDENLNTDEFINNGIIEDHFDSFQAGNVANTVIDGSQARSSNGVNITNNGIIIAPFETDDNTDPLLGILNIGSITGNFNIETAWENVSGGADGTYEPGSNDLDLVNFLAEGSHEFHFDIENDDGKCTQEMSLFVAVGEAPFLTCTTTDTDAIDNQNNGSAIVEVMGSHPPFTFKWAGPNGFTATTDSIDSLVPGSYQVTVTDARSDSTICSLIIINKTTLSCTINPTHATNGQANGSAVSTTIGGVPPYDFEWTSPNGFVSPFQNATNMAAGDYVLRVMDIDGGDTTCTTTILNIVNNGDCGATTITWTGGFQVVEDTIVGDKVSWNDPLNWDQRRVPDANDVILMDKNLLHNPLAINNTDVDIPSGITIKKLRSVNGMTHQILGGITVTCELFIQRLANLTTKITGINALITVGHLNDPFIMSGEIDVVGPGIDETIVNIFGNPAEITGIIKVNNQSKGIGTLLDANLATNNGTIELQNGRVGIKDLGNNLKPLSLNDLTIGIERLTENNNEINMLDCDIGIKDISFNRADGVINASKCQTAILNSFRLTNDGEINIGFDGFCGTGMVDGLINNGIIEMHDVGIAIDVQRNTFTDNGVFIVGNAGNRLEKIIAAGLNGTFISSDDFEFTGFRTSGIEAIYENPAGRTAKLVGRLTNDGQRNAIGFSRLIKNEGTIEVSNCDRGVQIAEFNSGLIDVDDCGIGMIARDIEVVNINEFQNTGTIKADGCDVGIRSDPSFVQANFINEGEIKIGFEKSCGIGFVGPGTNNNLIEMKKVGVGMDLGLGFVCCSITPNQDYVNNATINIGIEGDAQTDVGTGIRVGATLNGFGKFINADGILSIEGFTEKGIHMNVEHFRGDEYGFFENNSFLILNGKLDENGAPVAEVGIENYGNFVNDLTGTLEIKNIRTIGIKNEDLTDDDFEPKPIFQNKSEIKIDFIGVNANSPGAQAIANLGNGQFENLGDIFIGATGAIKGVGIFSSATGFNKKDPLFDNTGILEIDNILNGGSPEFETGHGILLDEDYRKDKPDESSFTNTGTIKIGSKGPIAKDGLKMIGDNGLFKPFTNEELLTIDQTGRHGINIDVTRGVFPFLNEKNINIGQQFPIGGKGIRVVNGRFENMENGIINIDDIALDGIEILLNIPVGYNPFTGPTIESRFNNLNKVTLGENKPIGGFGIFGSVSSIGSSNHKVVFLNGTNGTLDIDECGDDAIFFDRNAFDGVNAFTNNGIIGIGLSTPDNSPIQGNGIHLEGVDFFNQPVNNQDPIILIKHCEENGLNIFGKENEALNFNNQGRINIEKVGSNGVNFNGPDNTFTNDGELTIKEVGGNGILMDEGGEFENNANATILIDNTDLDGINITGGVNKAFNNNGSIDIGTDVGLGENGLSTHGGAIFFNFNELRIMDAFEAGIFNESKFRNRAGADVFITDCPVGLHNKKEVINRGDGDITIKGYDTGILNDGSNGGFIPIFNQGFLVVQNTPDNGNDLSLKNINGAFFINDAPCGQASLFGKFENEMGATIINRGFFILNEVLNPLVFLNEGTFQNDGALMDAQERLDNSNITNNNLFLRANLSGNLVTGEVEMPVMIGASNNFKPESSWNSNNVLGNGIYDFATNKVTFPKKPVPAGEYLVDFKVTDEVNNCNQILRLKLNFDALLVVSNSSICEGTSVTFTATFEGQTKYEFFKDANNNDVIDQGELLQSGLANTFVSNTVVNLEHFKVAITQTANNEIIFSNGIIMNVAIDNDSDGFCIFNGECNDNDATIFPGAPELCDGKANNCGGGIPENEVDEDMDGFFACEDCDDNNPTIFPNAPELCDSLDNNCDGIIPANEADTDGDGTFDCNDNCPNDANKIDSGQCGCDVADTDTDNDGTADCNDPCPNDPTNQCNIACSDMDLVIDDDPIAEGVFATSKTINSAGRVDNDSTIDFKAAISITLNAGFHAEAGSNFTAKIEACAAIFIASETSTARVDNFNSETPSRSLINALNKELELPNLKTYPNPMRDQTTLEITLFEATDVYLNLYNLNGQKISTLVNGESLPKGIHNYQWQCEQVEAGMYLLVMNGRNVGKLVIVR